VIAISAGLLIAGATALAQQPSPDRSQLMTNVPKDSATVTDWYKQNLSLPKTRSEHNGGVARQGSDVQQRGRTAR
jgi:hypothetical protein